AQRPITIAAGRADGMYWRLAGAVAQEVPARGVHPVMTQGVEESLEKLERGEVRFALAQQDVVSEYFLNTPGTRVKVVGRIFFEYLHIFVRDSVHVEQTSDLARLRLWWVGEPGSGTRLTASRFLDSLGTPLSSLGGRILLSSASPRTEAKGSIPVDLLIQEFRNDRLDVAMLVATPGLPPICELMGSGTVSLLPLDPKTLRELTAEEETHYRRQTVLGRIPANTYANQSEPVATIAVPVLFLARENEHPETARFLLQATREAWARLVAKNREAVAGKTACKIPDNSPEAAPLGKSKLHFLAGVEVDDPLWPRLRPLIKWIALLLALSTLGFWGYQRGWHEQVRILWRQDRLPFLLALLLALGIALVTLTTYLLERGINEHFSTLGESFWSITIYLFSGLEGRSPYTEEGRIVAALGLLLGPAFFAVTSGWMARFFIHREKRMPYNLKDHFLLLNWSPRAADVVRELHHPIIREREGTFVVVVLTDDESMELRRFKEAGSGRDEAFEDFFISVGNPTDERALCNANAADTRSILILSNDEHGDERTIRSVLMLRKIAREVGRTDLHVVAELTDPANQSVLEELAKDFPGLLEPISGMQIRTFLLSQAALSAGIVGFYSELLKISPVTNEMYTLDLPPGALGMTFRDYAAMVLKTYPDEPLVPVGVQRMIDGRSRMLTNPRRGAPGWVLEAGDRLLVMAYLPPLPGALPIPQTGEPLRP
ncbi:MAG: hypothetical protein JF614_29655, partial [Acidobacteria bacterium]|nr:hypothetical protein [Acidobacteriota bacterium]